MKKLVIVLILVLIVFAVVLTWGAARDDSGERSSEWVDFLGLTESPPVTASQFASNPCVAAGEIRVATRCSLRLREADGYGPRELKLRRVEGSKLRVEIATRGKTGLRTSLTLEPGKPSKPVSFQIPREGADVTLTCLAPPPGGRPCRVALR